MIKMMNKNNEKKKYGPVNEAINYKVLRLLIEPSYIIILLLLFEIVLLLVSYDLL